MKNRIRAVFFDVDGVLLDSLPQHLKICADLAQRYGLKLQVPTADAFRKAIANGMKVSPMREFFARVGFEEPYLERAVQDYEQEFDTKYRPKKFAGVAEMLASLRRKNVQLGLVTSNTKANVVPALGEEIDFFAPEARFFFHSDRPNFSKSASLDEGARRLGLDAEDCLYVGDQPADAVAAEQAGCQFLGVTYGWGIDDSDDAYPSVDAVEDIPNFLISAV